MEKKIKVLHIGEYVQGGVATYLKTLFRGSENMGVEHYLMLSGYKSEKNWNIRNDKIFYYPYKRNWKYFISTIYKINKAIQKVQPDIIHIHSTWAGVYARTLYLFKKKKAKIIYSPHGWSFLIDTSPVKKKLYFLIESMLSHVTDVIINISKYEQEQATKLGMSPKKMTMIYNGVEEAAHSPNKKNKTGMLMDRTKINLLFVGRLDRQKGLDLFLNVYSRLALNHIHLYVIGKGILEKKESTSNQSTTYLGWIDNKEIDKYYQECDAVIIPSRWEGFGLVAIEAMRNRKPVIASNRGALPELMVDGKNGYIFDLENIIELKNILMNLDKDRLKKMGLHSRELYLEKFKECYFRNKTYQLYKNFIK